MLPGALATNCSTCSTPRGAGNAMLRGRAGTADSSCSSRSHESRTFTTDCHCDTTCTSGASMRPPSTDATIIMPPPPCSSLRSSNQALRPSSSELSTFCTPRETAWYPPARSEASACSDKNSCCRAIQRRCVSRSMPMDSITSALRNVPSAYCWAEIALRLACIKGGLVLRSLNHATAVCKMANATADHPSTGLIRNSSTIITSAMGASIMASSAGENRKSRTCRKSLKGCCVPPGMRLRLASKMALKMRTLIFWSSSTLAECISSLRAHSSTSISTYAPTTASVSITSVVWLRLSTTRAYTSSM